MRYHELDTCPLCSHGRHSSVWGGPDLMGTKARRCYRCKHVQPVYLPKNPYDIWR